MGGESTHALSQVPSAISTSPPSLTPGLLAFPKPLNTLSSCVMGEPTISPTAYVQPTLTPSSSSLGDRVVFSLEEALLKALPSLLPNLLGTTKNPRAEFYDRFQCEADEYDRDFKNKYDEDLNTTLVFVSGSCITTSIVVLICSPGRSILRGRIRFHSRRSEQSRT